MPARCRRMKESSADRILWLSRIVSEAGDPFGSARPRGTEMPVLTIKGPPGLSKDDKKELIERSLHAMVTAFEMPDDRVYILEIPTPHATAGDHARRGLGRPVGAGADHLGDHCAAGSSDRGQADGRERAHR